VSAGRRRGGVEEEAIFIDTRVEAEADVVTAIFLKQA
jgi:hypothetical protein